MYKCELMSRITVPDYSSLGLTNFYYCKTDLIQIFTMQSINICVRGILSFSSLKRVITLICE